MIKRWISTLCCALLLMTSGCALSPSTLENPSPSSVTTVPSSTTSSTVLPVTPPSTENRVMKAVWVPFMEVNTLYASGSVEETKAAIDACLDDCRDKGFNTVFFHVRANSDAYYDSSLFRPHKTVEPLLQAGFDPLAYVVEQAHSRLLELHAWVNPYRVGADPSFAVSEDVFEYNGKYYYDPSSDEVKTLVTSGVGEIVDRYAVDGVQFDDYFYPQGAVSSDTPADFETARFDAYAAVDPTASVGDWRRLQVSELVSSVYATVHRRDDCVFGISPAYDIATVRDGMYADVEEWAKTRGYVDYLCPQLYFGFTHQYAPFMTLLAAWDDLERSNTVALYAGLGLYKTGLFDDTYAGVGRSEWNDGGNIISRQILILKEQHWDGVALYSHQSFHVGDDRDGEVVAKEVAAACEAMASWTE